MLSELSAIITLAGDYGLRRYELPEGMRYSTLKERGKFYREEFDPKVVDTWLKGMMKRPVFAVIIGRHTKIYPKKYREDASTTILIDGYSDLNDVRAQILEFLPESVYYDRNVYDEEGNAFSCVEIKTFGGFNWQLISLGSSGEDSMKTSRFTGFGWTLQRSMEDRLKPRQHFHNGP